jgi:hypothetical protein
MISFKELLRLTASPENTSDPVASPPVEVDMMVFLLDTFATRDAMQRAAIRQLEQVVQQQALQLTWFQAHCTDQKPGLEQ